MLKIVKNRGQVSGLKGRWVYMYLDKDFGEIYANIGIKPVVGLIVAKFKGYI